MLALRSSKRLAIEAARQAVALSKPSDFDAHEHLAKTLLQFNEVDDAINIFQR